MEAIEGSFEKIFLTFSTPRHQCAVETRLHSFLEIFCHFQNCKTKVSWTNGSKVTTDCCLVSTHLAHMIPYAIEVLD